MAARLPDARGTSHGGKDNVVEWLGTTDQIKHEAKKVIEQLNGIRQSYAIYSHAKPDQISIPEARQQFADWNEQLLEMCISIRKKYLVGDKTMIMKQSPEDQVIQRLQTEKLNLERKLLEMTKSKDQALNRLSELQSRVLKNANPEITDLSDENRPTKLGEMLKQLYEDEWTDAFEFLTETRQTDRLAHDAAIQLLYNMLKDCYEASQEGWKLQYTAFANVVTNPALITSRQVEENVGQMSTPPGVKQTANKNVLEVRLGTQQTANKNDPEVKPGTKQTANKNDLEVKPGTKQTANKNDLEVKPGIKQTANKNALEVKPQPYDAKAMFAQTVPPVTGQTRLDQGAAKGSSAAQGCVMGIQQMQKQLEGSTSEECQGISSGRGRDITTSAQIQPAKGQKEKEKGSTSTQGQFIHEPAESETRRSMADQDDTVGKGRNMVPAKVDVSIKEFCRNVAAEMVNNLQPPNILAAVSRRITIADDDISQNEKVKTYLVKCFNVCWLMLSRYPPMVIDFSAKPGIPYNQATFDVYSNRGPTVRLVVWPPIYLHKDGPVVCKGYVDCTK